jgi:hypothetical protein
MKRSVPAGQVAPYALVVGCDSAADAPPSISENLTAGRARDKKQRRPPPPLTAAITYRVEDAVVVSGLSRANLYRQLQSGKLRSVFVAGRRLIPADALREFLRGAA